MPHFTLQIGAAGPVLNTFVGVSAPRLVALQKVGQQPPALVPARALVDTGASHSCIDPSVLSQLGLSPTGTVSVHTPSTGGTPHQANQYDVALYIPGRLTGQQPLILPTLAVTESALHMQGIQALIGRDILIGCLLVYDGALGQFTLAF